MSSVPPSSFVSYERYPSRSVWRGVPSTKPTNSSISGRSIVGVHVKMMMNSNSADEASRTPTLMKRTRVKMVTAEVARQCLFLTKD